ncbi:hypothetical protein MJL48_34675, partial [Salmonella enterica subsp. enterica serovar Kentucky]|nr:hypothetical protein [Salmonella enterica subsp. enterica serovar Kentucky]
MGLTTEEYINKIRSLRPAILDDRYFYLTVELQTLIDRLADVIPMVNEIRGQKRQEAMKLLEGVVGTGSFAS